MKIFNYSTFSTQLEKKTRTLFVDFYDQKNHGCIETLFELESLLNWASERVEIHSILISTSAPSFDLGFTQDKIQTLKADYIQKVFTKIHKLSMDLLNLPQTIIFDLGKNPTSLAFQLSLGADTRLFSKNTTYNFSPLSLGLSVAPGSMALSQSIFGNHIAKNLFMKAEVSATNLEAWGVGETYETALRENQINEQLIAINEQAPIPRIQMKLVANKNITTQIAEGLKFEKSAFKAAQIAEDWKSFDGISQQGQYTPAQHMSYILQTMTQQEAPLQSEGH